MKQIGYVVFRIDSGIINYEAFTLCKTKEEAVSAAKNIIHEFWREDRYANPEHEMYSDRHIDDVTREYAERYAEAEALKQCISLTEQSDLIITSVINP